MRGPCTGDFPNGIHAWSRPALKVEQGPFSRLRSRTARVEHPEYAAFALGPGHNPQPLHYLIRSRTHRLAAAVDIVPTLQLGHEPREVSCTGTEHFRICQHGQGILLSVEIPEMPRCVCRPAHTGQKRSPCGQIILGIRREYPVRIDMYIMCIIILPQPVCYPPEEPGVHVHLEAFFPHICKHRISIWSKIRKGIVFHPVIHSHTDERIIRKRTLSRFIEKHPALPSAI